MQNLTESIKESLKDGFISLLLSINSGVNSLFLEIGEDINQSIESLPRFGEDEIISKISSSLCPFFGDYLSSENLFLMNKLAQRCSSDAIKHAIVMTSWRYVPLFLELKESNAWIFYSELIFTDNLSPQQLKDKISKEYFEKVGKKNHTNRSVYEFANYENIVDMYFGVKDGKKFRKLFEPNEKQYFPEDQKLKHGQDLDNVILNIQEKILTFQSLYNHDLNLTFNLMLWKVSYEIFKVSNSSDAPIMGIAVDYIIQELRKIFPSVFDESEIVYLLKFAKTERPPTELLQTVSWSYLKLLVDIELNKQISIANHVLKNGLTIQELKELLSNRLSDAKLDVEPVNAVKRKVIETIITENDVTIKGRMGIIEENIHSKHDLNRNIYKNPELLKFLKEAANFN